MTDAITYQVFPDIDPADTMNITFPVGDESEVKLYADGVLVAPSAYYWSGPTQIVAGPSFPANIKVRVQRETSVSAYAPQSLSGFFDAHALNTNMEVAFSALQEHRDTLAALPSSDDVLSIGTTLGTFTGSTIPDDQTIKQAFQAVETAVELRATQTALDAAITAAANATASLSSTTTTALSGKQPLDADLTAIAALPSAADKVPFATGAQTWSLATLTAFARTLLDDADAAAVLTTLGFSAFVQSLKGAADQTAFLTALGISTTYLLPVGSIVPFLLGSAPAGWLECNGAAVSRATYSGLFGTISGTFGAYTTNGSEGLTFTSVDADTLGLVGCYVTGTGIPAGTQIIQRLDANTMVMSQQATVTTTGTSIRFYRGAGAGDGTTTFNLPDLRGEFLRGWDHGRGVDETTGRGLGGGYQADSIKDHVHPIQATQLANTTATGASNRISTIGSGGAFANTEVPFPSHSETRPRNVSAMYCIKT